MLELIRFEFKKSLCTKTIIGAFFLMLVCNFAFLERDYYSKGKAIEMQEPVTRYNQEANIYHYIQELHQRYDGTISGKKIDQMINEYKKKYSRIADNTYSKEYTKEADSGYWYGDYSYYQSMIYEPMKYATTYRQWMEKERERWNKDLKFYHKHHNLYGEQKMRYRLAHTKGRRITEFFDTRQWEYLYQYHESDLLILLFLILCVAPVFLLEKQNGMDMILATNRQGRRAFKSVKYIVISLTGIAIVVVMSAMNYLVINGLYGLPGAFRPLYCIMSYKDTMFQGSLVEFYLWQMGTKILGFLGMIWILCLCAELAKNYVQSVLSQILVCVLMEYISGFALAKRTSLCMLSTLSPMSLLWQDKANQELYSMKIFGNLILVLWINIGVILVEMLINIIIQKRSGE